MNELADACFACKVESPTGFRLIIGDRSRVKCLEDIFAREASIKHKSSNLVQRAPQTVTRIYLIYTHSFDSNTQHSYNIAQS